jgi:hypothetical protein
MNDNLQHHGIKGQKWGVRRFQKKDGSLTPEGKKRYDDEPGERKEGKSKDRPSRGKRVVKTILRTVMVDTTVNAVSAHLMMTGKDEAAKALRVIGAAYSWGTLGRDVVDIVKNK